MPESWVRWILRITRADNCVSQVDGDSDMEACREGGRLNKEILSERKLPLQPCPEARQFRPPRTSLVPFKLLELRMSELRVCKSLHGPFKRSAWDSSCPRLTPPRSPLVFTARSYGDVSPRHWNWGAWCGAGTPVPPGGTSADDISLPMFNGHLQGWDQPVLPLSPYPSRGGFFCVSLVVGLRFH